MLKIQKQHQFEQQGEYFLLECLTYIPGSRNIFSYARVEDREGILYALNTMEVLYGRESMPRMIYIVKRHGETYSQSRTYNHITVSILKQEFFIVDIMNYGSSVYKTLRIV